MMASKGKRNLLSTQFFISIGIGILAAIFLQSFIPAAILGMFLGLSIRIEK